MTTFKKYCKEAKERMRNGFWQETKEQLSAERETAATMGIDTSTVIKQQRERISLKIYNQDEYAEEQRFYDNVVKILESEQVVLNPLPLLADQSLLSAMSPEQKQGYLLKLSDKYQKAVEKYNQSKGKK